MMFKKTTRVNFVVAILVSILLFTSLVPTSALAKEKKLSPTELAVRIELLKAEVVRLEQALLATKDPVTLKFFPLDFESVYQIRFGQLVRYGSPTKRRVDQELFSLLLKVLGEKRVGEDLKEFRVFYEAGSGLGAFVETFPRSDKWVFGVNRDLYESGNRSADELIVELYIHEYAHILSFKDPKMEEVFSGRFWTKADERHANKVSGLKDDELFDELNAYFENNSSRFVTDYATTNVDEDMAETFVQFVLEEMPTTSSLKARKILFFYNYPVYEVIRQELRNNLNKMSML